MSTIAPSLSRPAAQGRPVFLVGRDFAASRPAPRRAPVRFVGVLLAGSLLAALPLAGLRVQLTTLQYQLGEALRTERSLDEERRALRVELQRLRNPKRLTEIAAREGFVRPSHVIALPPAEGSAPGGGAPRP
jgi:hypothetical protein